MISSWVLDLDNTLYPVGSGLFARINERIDLFLRQRLGISEVEIPALRLSYRERYGVTLGGLLRHHQVDAQEYLDFVHDVPLAPFLEPDPRLGHSLRQLPGRRVIFTNGSARHAESVLSRLGLKGEIEAIYDIAFMDYIPKPFPHGYRKLIDALGGDPASCCLVDDLPENLDTGRALGMKTVLVADEPRPPHLHIRTAVELVELWGSSG